VKITKVDLYELEIPPIPAIARYLPKIFNVTLCRIQTDQDLQGWGEYQSTSLIHQQQAEALVGKDPLAIDPYTFEDAFTCALLDISGQAYNIPLHRFFGAQVRDKVPVSYWSCHMEPRETAAEAEVGAKLGFINHKLKARSWNIVETVRLVKEAVGSDYTIGADPNTQFSLLPNAARLAEELEPYGTVSVLEDPMRKSHLEWYRMLREKTHIPIALHLGHAAPPSAFLAALKAEAIDYVNLGGTALEVRQAAEIAHAADVPCWIQMGGLCTGVMASYSVHLQATLANATLPCDELPFTREADVLAEGLALAQGQFTVPQGPGLGIKVDMQVINRYRVG